MGMAPYFGRKCSNKRVTNDCPFVQAVEEHFLKSTYPNTRDVREI